MAVTHDRMPSTAASTPTAAVVSAPAAGNAAVATGAPLILPDIPAVAADVSLMLPDTDAATLSCCKDEAARVVGTDINRVACAASDAAATGAVKHA